MALLVMLSGCGGFSIPSDMVAVQEGRGAEAKKVKGCKDPSTRAWFGNDEYYYFPTNEREWEATGQKGSDSGRFTSVTADSVQMYIPTTIRFTIDTECEKLKAFYTKYVRRSGAKFEDDGSYNDEWLTLLRKLVANPTDATLDRIVQTYNWRDVWNNPATKAEIEKKLDDALSSSNSLLVQIAKDDYFQDISVIIGQAAPVEDELARAVAVEQTNVAKAKSAEAQAIADTKAAEAQIAVSKAEAAKKEAEVAGFGSVENYLKYLCITTQTNCNPFQPTYIVGAGATAGK